MQDAEHPLPLEHAGNTCEYVPTDKEHCDLLLAWIEREITKGNAKTDDAHTHANDNPYALLYQQEPKGMAHFDGNSVYRIILKGPSLAEAKDEKITLQALTPQGMVELKNVPVSFLKDRPLTDLERLIHTAYKVGSKLWNLLPGKRSTDDRQR